jgi:hypothetical protein
VLFIAIQFGVRLLLKADPELGEREFGRKLSLLRAAVAENRGRPLILMLGSSRMATAFRPDALPGLPVLGPGRPIAFNFAVVGSGPEMSLLVLHRVLAAGIRPDWVFMEYWPPFWFRERSLSDYHGQISLGRLDVSGVRMLASYVRRPQLLYRAWLEAFVVPSYSYRSAMFGRYAPAWVTGTPAADHTLRNLDRWGFWSPRAEALPEFDHVLRARMLEHYRPILAEAEMRAAPDRALRAILDICRRQRIRASVVFLPEGDAFRNCYPPGTLTKVDDYLRRIQRECHVSLIDARTWVGESAFMDSHHLFPVGATVFTARLGREIAGTQVAHQADSLREVP